LTSVLPLNDLKTIIEMANRVDDKKKEQCKTFFEWARRGRSQLESEIQRDEIDPS
jgi:hypothetical protein